MLIYENIKIFYKFIKSCIFFNKKKDKKIIIYFYNKKEDFKKN